MLEGVPVWILIVVGAVVLLIAALAVSWFVFGRRALVRRYLIGLVGRRESVRASKRTLEAVMRHLADETDEALTHFAENPAAEDRRSLVEVRDQMRVLADELDTRPMPSRLVRVAEELADAAFVVAEEAGRISDDMEGDEVFSALAEIDLGRVATQAEEADHWIDEARVEYEVEDAAVYGGGLYI